MASLECYKIQFPLALEFFKTSLANNLGNGIVYSFRKTKSFCRRLLSGMRSSFNLVDRSVLEVFHSDRSPYCCEFQIVSRTLLKIMKWNINSTQDLFYFCLTDLDKAGKNPPSLIVGTVQLKMKNAESQDT